jgi:hypothetical protein
MSNSQPIRVVIASTPRTGNTWLRHLLSTVYQIPTIAVHNPRDLDWDQLPPECVLQMHWHPIPSFLSRLEKGGFRVVVMARHPLDVLISILHFSLHEPTARWLEGEDGNERPIYGAMPRSSAFLRYATGKRSRILLSVTPEWWSLPGAIQIRYEALLHDQQGELERLVRDIGGEPRQSLAGALGATTIPRLRVMAQNDHHFWQGKAGLWKKFLPVREAVEIARAHVSVFDTLGYTCDPDLELVDVQADLNWINMAWADLASDLQSLREFKREVEEWKGKAAGAEAELAKARAEIEQTRAAARIEADQLKAAAEQTRQQAKIDIDRVLLECEQVRQQSQLTAEQQRFELTARTAEVERLQTENVRSATAQSAAQAELERVRIEYVRLQHAVQEIINQKNAIELAGQTAKANVEGQLEEARRRLREEHDKHVHARAAIEDQLRQTLRRLREFEDLNPRGVAVARRLSNFSRNHPLMAKTAKKIFRIAG